ncbi:DUF7716 domain-containing protein [Zhihengliuella salsuginis]|uniref:DUF7716 domain-containing protein n=1 Tax=Zhihengliuella salsuginis TaxID=578222 RepID=A0ABQ3GGF3_9MICC|nr:hypothetical protein [Zhihengliuella salsuginis]GHD03993.1 hypothetical protein GCM10008096_10760 [Zhihengliuella salsuginis]
MNMLLGEVLKTAEKLPWTHALYAPAQRRGFDESTPVLVWDVDDVVDDATDLPAEAIALGYDYVLSVDDVQSIVANARAQRANPATADLLLAFRHYLARDAFIVWEL